MSRKHWITNSDVAAMVDDLSNEERPAIGRDVLFRIVGLLTATPDNGAVSSFVLRSTIADVIVAHKRRTPRKQLTSEAA